MGGSVGVFLDFLALGSLADLVIVICTLSQFSVVWRVELFNNDAVIPKVVCRLPGVHVVCRVASPLGTVREFVSAESIVDHFFNFVFLFSLYLDSRRTGLYLSVEFLGFVRF